jgi:capsular polysaccharide biosynthesis protein
VVSTISGNVFKKIEGSNFYLVESDYRHPYQALWSRGRPNKDPKSYFLGKCAVIPKRSGNYFHFFVEELPDILLEIEHVPNRILANHKIPNFQRDFLENFFQLEFTKYSEIRVETLIKATKSQCSSDIYSIERLSRVRALTNGLESNTHDSRIFVLRDSTDQVELGIARAFHSRGFRIETLVELPIFEQIRLFKNARCIVGFAGAGLTNLLFVNELSESTLVEICIDDMSNKYWKKSVAGPCWEPFALTLGAKYLFLYLNPYKDINSQIGYFIEEQLNN